MSSAVVVAAPVAPVAIVGALAVGAVALPVLLALAAAKESEKRLKEMRLEQEKQEKRYKDQIIQKIEQHLDNVEAKAKTAAADLEKQSALIREEIIADITASVQHVEEIAVVHEQRPQDAKKDHVRSAHSRDDLMLLHQKLSILDRKEAAAVLGLIHEAEDGLPGRADAVAVQIKLAIGRAKEHFADDIYYRKELSAIHAVIGKDQPNSDLDHAFAQALAGDALISRSVFEELARRYVEDQRLKAQENLAAAAIRMFRQQGYEMYDAQGNVARDAATGCLYAGLDADGDYHAMVRTSPDGELSLRLVRLVEDEKDIETLTEYQRQKDVETAKKWCAYCDTLVSDLQEAGIPAQSTIKHDEHAELLVMVNKELVAARAAARKRPRVADREFSAR